MKVSNMNFVIILLNSALLMITAFPTDATHQTPSSGSFRLFKRDYDRYTPMDTYERFVAANNGESYKKREVSDKRAPSAELVKALRLLLLRGNNYVSPSQRAVDHATFGI